MNETLILYIILFSIVHSLLSRLRETCTFDQWSRAWLAFWKISEDTKWGKWWLSRDKDELTEWYHYFWRDGYHAFKLLTILLMFAMLMYYNLYWILGLVLWGIVQVIFQWILNYMISRAGLDS
jgi:hypothetical protein